MPPALTPAAQTCLSHHSSHRVRLLLLCLSSRFPSYHIPDVLYIGNHPFSQVKFRDQFPIKNGHRMGEPCFKMHLLSPRWGILDLAIFHNQASTRPPHSNSPHHTHTHTPPPSTHTRHALPHVHSSPVIPATSKATILCMGGTTRHQLGPPIPTYPLPPPPSLFSHTFLTRHHDPQFCATCHSTQPHHHHSHHTDTHYCRGSPTTQQYHVPHLALPPSLQP